MRCTEPPTHVLLRSAPVHRGAEDDTVTIDRQRPLDGAGGRAAVRSISAMRSKAAGSTWFPEGSAAMVYGEHADLGRVLADVEGVAGVQQLAPDLHVVWGQSGSLALLRRHRR